MSFDGRIERLESLVALRTAARTGAAHLPKPQPGPQTAFVESQADIVIYGGAAGSGKTFGLLLGVTRQIDNGRFRAVIFRRTTPQIRNPGGLWDESIALFAPLGVESAESALEHRFGTGARVKFAHLEHEHDVYAWDGAQLPCIGFDQLEHFERSQFFYMLSRNRDPSGTVRPTVRATCNPDPDSWLAEFLAWWIDEQTGLPIPERAGKVRWFVRDDDVLVWADTREELIAQFDERTVPKSVTFIPGKVYDNRVLLKHDPGYLANLMALPAVERARLHDGNWKARASAGLLFRREWCRAMEAEPSGLESVVRYWDLAATAKTDSNDPDWTIGVKLGKYRGAKRYVLLDARRMRVTPAQVEAAMLNTAAADGRGVRIGFPQDPGQAGAAQRRHLAGVLSGYTVWSWSERGDKITRFGPFSAQCEHGNVDYVRGAWNEEFFRSLESFPDGRHKDDADACSGAFEMVGAGAPYANLIEFYRLEAERQKGRSS